MNLTTLETFDAGAEVTPDTLRARGLVAKRGLVKVLGPGRADQAAHRPRPRLLAGGGPGDRGRGRDRRDVCRCRGRPVVRRPEGTPSPTARYTAGSGFTEVVAPHDVKGSPACGTCSGSLTCGTRSSSRSSSSSSSGSGRTSPCRTSTSSAIQAAEGASKSAGGVARLPRPVLGRRAHRRSSVFFLGIMPYITASIIMQLLGVVIPKLEEWQNEGQTGQKKITQWTRYLTVALALDAVDRVRVRAEERQRRPARPVELPAAAGHSC